MNNDFDYWMLARFPRWLVVLVYTVGKILLGTLGLAVVVVGVQVFGAWSRANPDMTLVCIVGGGILLTAIGIARTTSQSLPRRKAKD